MARYETPPQGVLQCGVHVIAFPGGFTNVSDSNLWTMDLLFFKFGCKVRLLYYTCTTLAFCSE